MFAETGRFHRRILRQHGCLYELGGIWLGLGDGGSRSSLSKGKRMAQIPSREDGLGLCFSGSFVMGGPSRGLDLVANGLAAGIGAGDRTAPSEKWCCLPTKPADYVRVCAVSPTARVLHHHMPHRANKLSSPRIETVHRVPLS